MIKNRKLDYVVSGTSYMRFSNPSVAKDETNSQIINMLIDKLVTDVHSHKFSMLYNAHTESSFGDRFTVYKPHVNEIHADSGGLQIVTQGMVITDELKDKVYENQAKWADVGMCFDEIPVILTGGKSDRNDTKARFFDFENYEELARKTGRNVKRQLEIFDKAGSTCKPYIILQGNCIDTYLRWYELLMEEVPSEWHDRIGGVAMGAAALGTGPLEDVKRAFIASEIAKIWPQEIMHLHVLGVGSIRRMLPYLVFCQNGLYDNVEISYDSTTHSRAVETGLYYMGKGTTKFNRKMSNLYREMYNNVQETVQLGVDLDEFHELMNTPSLKAKEKYGNLNTWIYVRTAFILMSIRNFMAHLESMMLDKDTLLKFTGKLKLDGQFRNLYNVTNREEYDAWENNQYLGGSMKSMAVGTEAPSSLEDLFE
mgnify:CR=1 FL=1|jgi:hypothetical protein|tara:strand:- start:653 stop:1927 length:1275 start_codon:yes stop_codon:yes gene_type:complete